MKAEDYINQYQAVRDGHYSGEELTRALEAIFEDGFRDRQETELLQTISSHTAYQGGALVIDSKALRLARAIQTENVLTQKHFDRFRKSRALKTDDCQQVDLRVDGLTCYADDSFHVGLKIAFGVSTEREVIGLPSAGGLYPDGTRAGEEDPLLVFLEKNALQAVLPSLDSPLMEGALEAVSRMGIPPSMEKPAKEYPGGRQMELVQDEADRLSAGQECILISGICFKGAVSESVRLEIRRILESLPAHLLAAFGRIPVTMTLFDPKEIYPPLLESARLSLPPEPALSFGYPYSEAFRMPFYLDITALQALPHELIHALFGMMPMFLTEGMNTPESPLGGLSRYYAERVARIRYYPEDALTTSYQKANVWEFEAEGLNAFYTSPRVGDHIGSADEMRREDPLLFLAFLHFDAILKNMTDEFPPFWRAFTETARGFAEKYLEETGDQWDSPENLEWFLAHAINLDCDDEIIFWKNLQDDWPADSIEVREQAFRVERISEAAPGWEKIREYGRLFHWMAKVKPGDPVSLSYEPNEGAVKSEAFEGTVVEVGEDFILIDVETDDGRAHHLQFDLDYSYSEDETGIFEIQTD